MRAALLVAALLLSAGCWEDPVTETLEIDLGDDRRARVTAAVDFAETIEPGSPVDRRVSAVRDEYLHGRDAWTRRFESLRIDEETRSLTRAATPEGRVLRSVRHQVWMPFPELGVLFPDTGVVVTPIVGPGWQELSILPGRGSRASADERRLFDRALESVAVSGSLYLAETTRLWTYLEKRPDRAEAIFAALFEDVIEDEERGVRPLDEDEVEIVARVRRAMEDAAERVAGSGDGSAYGANELSLLVADPLPAAVRVCLPRAPEEVEGFLEEEDGCWAIPRVGIVDALAALEGYWIDPDPLSEWLRVHRAREGKTLDVTAFAARDRRWGAPPAPGALRRALEAAMQHRGAYRLRWVVD